VCLPVCLPVPDPHSMPDINSLVVEIQLASPVSLHRAPKGISRLVCASAAAVSVDSFSVDSSQHGFFYHRPI